MLYTIAAYWPFLLLALLFGVCVGWGYQDPRSREEDATAWLERGFDEP
jgi:hypothetical protein